MKLKKAAEILEKHNKWRRDNSVVPKYEIANPKELGIAIDTVVNHLSQFEKTISEIKNVDNMYLDKKNVLTRLIEINT